jgi:glutamyl/glutaminyl-tRNA synthetase
MLENQAFEVETLDQAIQDVSEKLEIKGKPLYMGIRIAATGDMHGPSLANCMALLEKNRVLNRLQKVADKLRGDL